MFGFFPVYFLSTISAMVKVFLLLFMRLNTEDIWWKKKKDKTSFSQTSTLINTEMMNYETD